MRGRTQSISIWVQKATFCDLQNTPKCVSGQESTPDPLGALMTLPRPSILLGGNTGALLLRGRGSGTFCRLNWLSWTIQAVSEDIPIRVVGLRRFVTLCKIAPYRNSLTYLRTYPSPYATPLGVSILLSSLLATWHQCPKIFPRTTPVWTTHEVDMSLWLFGNSLHKISRNLLQTFWKLDIASLD